MFDMQAMSKAVAEVAANLTNVVGLIEKNLESYDNIRNRNRARRLEEAVRIMLARLTHWRMSNDLTLWLLASWSDNDTPHPISPNWTERSDFLDIRDDYEVELTSFFKDILDTMQHLEQYSNDLIRSDYRLYEELAICISARRDTIRALLSKEAKRLSPDKLRELYRIYVILVSSTSACKERLHAILSAKPYPYDVLHGGV